MGSPCWGAPQQGLMAPNSSEFPDVRLQYRPSFGETLTACSKFVFTTNDTAIWEPICDQLPPTAA